MRYFYLLLLLSVLTFSIPISAQIAKPSATPSVDEETVKISTSLIQLDVVVSDRNGQPVTGLKPEDFKIFQDGKPQVVTNLTFVDSIGNERTEIADKNKVNSTEFPAPPASHPRARQGRVITFVLDDGNCLATLDGTVRIIQSMKKFINEQMKPDDRAAIYRTKSGSNLMQTYTSNREILLQKIDKMTLIPQGSCNSSFDAVRDKSTVKFTGQGAGSFESDADKAFNKDNNDRERENQVRGTLGVLGFVVDRLKNVGQRKIVFLLSEGIVADFDSRTYDALRELADKASRASVVINTFSSKGLTIPGFASAQDEILPGIVNGAGADQSYQAEEARIAEERALNQGISYLAYATGGTFVSNKNFLETEIKKVLDRQTSYYLIGYVPDDETFKGKEFHKIEVRVNQPGLEVSSRKGFYGWSGKETDTIFRSPDSPLYQAINSPFDEKGMNVRLTTLVGNDGRSGTYVRALLHIPGSDLTLSGKPNGDGNTEIDVVLVALDEKGKVAEEFNRSYPIRVPRQGISIVNEYGLDFSTDIPFRKPGHYTFRMAVRDKASKRVGSAGDIIEVPDFKSKRFELSGLVTGNFNSEGKPQFPAFRPINAAFSPVLTESQSSIRKYKYGTIVPYTYSVYNPLIDKNGKTDLTREIRLFMDGKLLADLPPRPLDGVTIGVDGRIDDSGYLRLGEEMHPGEYVLQVVVKDRNSKKAVSKWIDFEVVKR